MNREQFMEIVYGELHSDGNNNRANRIIDAADEYAEGSKPHWHPVSEQPQEEDDYLLLTHEKFKHGTFKRIIIGAWNNATKE